MMERMIIWFWERTRSYWIPLLLVGGILSVLVYSVDEANWVERDAAIINILSLGFFLGWALAYSRFPGWFVFVYALIFSVIVNIQAVGQVLPSIGQMLSTPFSVWVNETNLRFLNLWLRVTTWIETYQSGGQIEDTGLFVLIIGLLVWAASIWFLWFLVRKRSVLPGVLPLGFLLAFNVHLSRQPLTTYAYFLMFVILLVAWMAFRRQHRQWEMRQLDYPDSLGIEWSVSTVVLALMIILAARTAPLVGTPEGWQAISEWIESRRSETSETAERLFSAVNTPPPPQSAPSRPAVSIPNLREVGAPIPQGSEIIMWVTVSDPPPMLEEFGVPDPEGPEKGHYWRSSIMGEYTGRGWKPMEIQPEPAVQEALPEEPPVGRYYLRQEFEIEAVHSGDLFAVNEPVQGTEGIEFSKTVGDGSRLAVGEPSSYSVVSEATEVTGNQLAAAGMNYPQEIQDLYLLLPEELPERVRTLAERVAAAGQDPFHKALLIQNYLRINYPYTLGEARAPEGRDVVDYFLFEGQEGSCSHYSSAMVVMLRSMGIPARVAAGYATGGYDPGRNSYRVPVSAAHAWVEVYFPDYGWVEFEPTAYVTPFEYPETDPIDTAPLPALPAAEPGQPELQPVFLALLAAAALALIALPFWLMRFFSAPKAEPGVQVNALYRQMRRALSWAGIRAEPSVTPEEFLHRYGTYLGGYQRLDQALRQTTALYEQMVYSPRPPDARRVRAAGDLWRQSFPEWLRLWVRDRWQRFKARYQQRV